MTILEMAEGVSLTLTSPTILLAILLLYLWFGKAREALFTRNRSSTQWLLLGVFIGFAGGLGDNFFWGIAWTLSYLHHPWKGPVFESGALFNIFFRQGAGTVAAYCHLRAAAEHDGSSLTVRRLNTVIALTIVLGVAMWFGLHCWRL